MLYRTRSKIKPFLILSVLFAVSASTYLYFARENAAQSRHADADVLREFSAWAADYARAPHPSDLDRGRELLEQRMDIFDRLIEQDPKRIIENSLSPDVIAKLPSGLALQLERPVSFYGDFEVFILDLEDPVTGESTGSRTDRYVVVNGARYPATVYGRREGMTTKRNIPMRGVLLGEKIVVDEAPVQRIASAGQIGADVGGERREFASESDLQAFVNEQIEWESKIGPDREEANRPNSSWTEGAKTALLILVDFPDMPGMPKAQNGVPYTEAQMRQAFTQTVTPFYAENSYGKTSITMPTVTPVLRLPQTITFYTAGTNYTQLIADARTAARAAGFEHNNFDFDMTLVSRTPLYAWSGIALGGSNGIAINGAFDFRVVSHELGHNYGLPHANRWQTVDGTTLGNGSMVEYGDLYDSMGTGGNHTTYCHFNTYYKHRLDWLTANDIKVANESGTYRIFAHDIATTTTGTRALKIPRNSTSDYWVEFRQMFPSTPSLQNGATIRWEVGGATGASRTSHLLDATPLTANNQPDHALAIGQTLTDDQNRIRIKVLGFGNTMPESLDIQVETNFGCTFANFATANTNFPASGGEGTLTTATQSGCRMAPTSNADWIVPFSGTSGSAGFVVTANYGSQPRTGTLTFNGQTVTIQQAGANTACATRPAGLVGWWRGEGNTLDQVNSLNGATLGGGYSAGKIGAGISNSITSPGGAIAVRVPNSPLLALSQSLTVEGWIKVNAIGFTQRVVVTEQPSYDVQIDPEGVLYFSSWYPNPNGAGYVGTYVESYPLPVGQFVHFAGTLDDATGEMKLYINGFLVKQITTAARPMSHPSVALHIARMNGVADELSIYSRALAASEIGAIYAAGIAPTGAAGKCLTAAAPPTSITGRVFSPFGQALRNVAVILTDSAGARRMATTSSFGVYTFENVPAGTNYTMNVPSKRYRFNPRTMDIAGNLTNIDFFGLE
jgi:hypothetical protein